MPIFALCSILAPQILRLLYGAGFTDAAAVFRIYVLLLPLRPTAYGTVRQALSHTHTVLKGGLMAMALNATLGVGLTPIVGRLGPAFGAMIAQAALILYYLRRIGASPLARMDPLVLVKTDPHSEQHSVARSCRKHRAR